MFYYTTGSTVSGHDSKSFKNLYFYSISFCPAQSSKRWLLFENMASVPSESVKRSLSLPLSSPLRPSLTVKGLVDIFYLFVTDGTDN